jgi:uncharacterized protein (TIGR03435 family)
MTTLVEFRPVLFAVFWKSGIVLGAALCISLMLKKRSADLRRMVLSTTIVAMFVAAAASPVLPHWTAATPSWFQFQRPASGALAVPSLSSPPSGDAPEITTMDRRPIAPQAPSSRPGVDTWLLPLIWFAGAAMLLARFAINLRGLQRLRKASYLLTDTGMLANAGRFAKGIRVWRNDAIGAPVTWGIVRPIILVPTVFEELPAESRDAVIRHELAHIHAHDFLMRSLAEIARALIWFQPLMWIVWRQLREEQELACDNCVLAAGGKPSAYAKLLLDWDARRRTDLLVAVGIAHESCLKRRLYALLDPDLRRDTVAGAEVAGVLLLALAGALPLAAIGFREAIPVPLPPSYALQSDPRALLRPPIQLAQAQIAQSPGKPPQAATSPAARPRFEVVSIKPCKPVATGGTPTFGGDSSPGRLRIACGILADTDNVGLIQVAYNRYATGRLTSTKMIPIEGGPDWIHSERYDIQAESEGRESILMMQGPMLQTVLEDRFKLRVHRETRQGPVYELALGKASPNLKRLQNGKCTPAVVGSPLPVLPEGGHLCRNMASPQAINIEGGTLSTLADLLGMVLDRPVLNKTGMPGSFEMKLAFSPDDSPAPRLTTNDPGVPAVRTSDAPGIFQAIQEQLGLRLVPAKGPVDVLIIDHVERPSEN